MGSGTALSGFREQRIGFPPTYKWCVLGQLLPLAIRGVG
jgi:hypothetical protein